MNKKKRKTKVKPEGLIFYWGGRNSGKTARKKLIDQFYIENSKGKIVRV